MDRTKRRAPVVELSDCILCGLCADVSPSVFRINEAGYIEVADLPDYPEDEIDEAIKNCPASCISWN
jgi:ferredoxin